MLRFTAHSMTRMMDLVCFAVRFLDFAWARYFLRRTFR